LLDKHCHHAKPEVHHLGFFQSITNATKHHPQPLHDPSDDSPWFASVLKSTELGSSSFHGHHTTLVEPPGTAAAGGEEDRAVEPLGMAPAGGEEDRIERD